MRKYVYPHGPPRRATDNLCTACGRPITAGTAYVANPVGPCPKPSRWER